MAAGEVDEKTAAHRLLQVQRDKLMRLKEQSGRPQDQLLADILVDICDVLELQIRRIDQLENP